MTKDWVDLRLRSLSIFPTDRLSFTTHITTKSQLRTLRLIYLAIRHSWILMTSDLSVFNLTSNYEDITLLLTTTTSTQRFSIILIYLVLQQLYYPTRWSLWRGYATLISGCVYVSIILFWFIQYKCTLCDCHICLVSYCKSFCISFLLPNIHPHTTSHSILHAL